MSDTNGVSIMMKKNLPIAPFKMEIENQELFLGRQVAPLDIWLEIIEPPESATLPCPS